FHLTGHDRCGQRDNKIGVVIAGAQLVGAEVDDFVRCLAQLGDQLLLQAIASMIGGNAYTHNFPKSPSRAKSAARMDGANFTERFLSFWLTRPLSFFDKDESRCSWSCHG